MAYLETDPPQLPGAPTNNRVASRPANVSGEKVQLEQLGYENGTGDYQAVDLAHPLPVGQLARNTHGTAAAVGVGSTATVVTFVADSVFKLRGFSGTGEADGLWRLKYNGTTVYADRTHITRQAALLILPSPDAGAANQTVTVEVTNNGTSVADFECTLLGE